MEASIEHWPEAAAREGQTARDGHTFALTPEETSVFERIETYGDQQVLLRYSLFEVRLPSGVPTYFMMACARQAGTVEVAVSPALPGPPAVARSCFARISHAGHAVFPVHLTDIVRDAVVAASVRDAVVRLSPRDQNAAPS